MQSNASLSPLPLDQVAQRLGAWAATAERQAAAARGESDVLRYGNVAAGFRQLEASIVAAIAQPAARPKASKAAAKLTAEQFFDAFQAARKRACELYTDRWVILGYAQHATLPKGLRSFRGERGGTIRLGPDVHVPPAGCWPRGVIPLPAECFARPATPGPQFVLVDGVWVHPLAAHVVLAQREQAAVDVPLRAQQRYDRERPAVILEFRQRHHNNLNLVRKAIFTGDHHAAVHYLTRAMCNRTILANRLAALRADLAESSEPAADDFQYADAAD